MQTSMLENLVAPAAQPLDVPVPELFRTIVRSSLDGLLACDRDLRITLFSESMERVSGLSAAEVMGCVVSEVFPGLGRGGVAPLLEALEGRTVFTSGAPFRRAAPGNRATPSGFPPAPSGREHPCEAYCTPVEDDGGEVVGALVVVHDSSGPRRVEEALRASEERYWRLLEDSLTGNVVAGSDGRLLACNAELARIFGFTSVEEALAYRLDSLFPSPRAHTAFLNLLRERRRLRFYETELRRADGEPLHVIANFTGVFDEEGRLLEVHGFLFDNTDRKALEEQLRQAQKMESIGTLAGGLAHDFNNILHIIQSHAALLSRTAPHGGPVGEKLAHGLAAVQAAVERGSGLVKQLLTFARRAEASLQPIDLSSVVDEFLKMCTETFPRSIAFDVRSAAGLPPVIADRNQIHQALLNLCLNARDAMPSGGRLSLETGKVPGRSLRRRHPSAADADYLFVRVADSGTGMDDDTLRRIFDPFFTTKEPGRGTGLGLAVVYGIVKGHAGFVEVESEPGRGTIFTLYLPAASAESAPAERSTMPFVAAGAASGTVLLVEDEELLLDAVGALLESEGFRVLRAHDGVEALELHAQGADQIDVVLADLGLPRLGGWELFLRLKAERPEVKVVLTSGLLERKEKLEMLSSGVRSVLRKPYGPEEVVSVLREVLSGD